MPTRRTVLGSIGATGTVVIAGCLGGDDEEDNSPDDSDDQNDNSDDGNNGNSSDGNGDQNNGNGEQDDWTFDGDPADVPGEEAAKGTVDAYLLAISGGDPGLFSDLVHPASPLAGRFSDEDIEETGQYLNYRYRNMTVAELDRESGRARVQYDLAVIVGDQEPQTSETSQELRVYEGEWKIWLTTPPEGGDAGE